MTRNHPTIGGKGKAAKVRPPKARNPESHDRIAQFGCVRECGEILSTELLFGYNADIVVICDKCGARHRIDAHLYPDGKVDWWHTVETVTK